MREPFKPEPANRTMRFNMVNPNQEGKPIDPEFGSGIASMVLHPFKCEIKLEATKVGHVTIAHRDDLRGSVEVTLEFLDKREAYLAMRLLAEGVATFEMGPEKKHFIIKPKKSLPRV